MKRYKIFKILGLIIPVFILVTFLFAIPHAYALEPAYKVLKNTSSGMGAQVKDIWTILINLVNSFIIVLLIIVAFAQILRLNINTYGIKKILPSLIFAIIAANFSFLFCRLLVDFANIAINALIDANPASNNAITTIGNSDWASPATLKVREAVDNGRWGTMLWFIFAQFFVFAAGILVLILAFLFLIRLWVIYFLVALSPLAMMAMVLPQTKSIFGQWWTNMSKWTFMPVISVFWVWLAGKWVDTLDTSGNSAFLLTFLFSSVCLYLAITTPFKMGGAIMKTWSSLPGRLGKYAGNTTAGKTVKAWGNAKLQEQGAKGRWYNPVGNYMRMKQMGDMRLKHYEGRAKNYNEAATARLMKTRTGRGFENEARKWGGDIDMAKEEITRDYLQTDAGKKWAKGRAEYYSKLGTTKSEAEKGLKEGERGFREGDEGSELAKRKLLADRERDLNDAMIADADKMLITNFNQRSDKFNKPEEQKLIDEYFAYMARGKNLDEAVSKSSADPVNAILADQVAIENIKKALSETTDPTKQQELIDSAIRIYDNSANQGALKGMVDTQNRQVIGFAGTIEGSDQLKKDIGDLMKTRAGKLMSIEIKGDAEKLLDANTVEEISDHLQHGTSKISLQAIDNFKAGSQHLNDPGVNKDIEAHLLAITKIARQNNHPESGSAKQALVSMLNDDATLSAVKKFNDLARTRPGIQPIDENLSRADQREVLLRNMTIQKTASPTFAAVLNQRNVGSSDNAGNYLSGGSRGGGNITPEQLQGGLPREQYGKVLAVTTQAAMQSNGSYTEMVKKLGANKDVASSTLEAMNNHFLFEKNHLANAIGKSVGLSMNETIRASLTNALRSVPKGASTQQIADTLNPVIQQYGGKKIDEQSAINLARENATNKVSNQGLAEVSRRFGIIDSSLQGIKMLKQEPKIREMTPYVQHFSNHTPQETNNIRLILEKTISTVEGPGVSHDQIPDMIHKTLSQAGLVPKDTPITSDTLKSIELLKKFKKASEVASSNYDGKGFFRVNSEAVQDAIAKDALAREAKKNER